MIPASRAGPSPLTTAVEYDGTRRDLQQHAEPPKCRGSIRVKAPERGFLGMREVNG